MASKESVATWLSSNAISFGLELIGDADVKLAGTIVLQANGYGPDGPPSACEELPNSGL